MKRIISAILLVCMLMFTLCSCDLLGAMSGDRIDKITITESSVELTVGDTKTLDIEVEPEGASTGKIDWSSSDNNIVTVNDGTVRAVAAGNAVITAESEDGAEDTCNVTVKEKTITDISLNKTSTSVKVGSTIQLEAFVTPADAPRGSIKWASDDSSIATVNSEGYITGIKAGVVNIVCSSGDIEASCTVTVKGEPSANNNNSGGSSSNNSGGTVINNYINGEGSSSSSSTTSSDYIFPQSSSRKLTYSEVNSKLNSMSGYSPSGSYAQDAINEIYARNGYVFKSSNLNSYYRTKSWYYPNSSFSTAYFTSVENYNIKLLGEYT